MTSDPTVTRFAPSATGSLHLGHLRPALEGWRAVRGDGGDIDQTCCRDEYAVTILEDLVRLGLSQDGPCAAFCERYWACRRPLPSP
jgi:glutamyl-Q tRNA(Asp) synthetase